MITPQTPENEIERLQALHGLKILDTQAEERFDYITRVVQNLFNVPIASVSFVDKEREWYKSKYGLLLSETPRAISFGGHAILQEEIMVVNDALKDPRFVDNPLVVGDPEIRFYLGCPLKLEGQFNIGTLSLIDHSPKQLTKIDLNIMKDLAAAVEAEFDAFHQSTIDELTQLPNLQGFRIIGKQIIQRCNQYDKRLLLLFFDLNRVKFINDNYGHDEGDLVLKIFSEQLLKNFRRSDAVARIGGDKFCVLCAGMSKEHIPNVIKRFQHKLLSAQTIYPIEFSMGAILYDRFKHYSINSLIEEADEKIYEYKRSDH